jgi:autotransporter-associated beta strand protein
MKSPILSCALVLTLSLGALCDDYAGSATWSANPVSGDWNTAANWTPNTVPNGPDDVATFGVSNITAVTVSTAIEVNSIVFDSGASPFTINPNGHLVTISGAGVMNNSGITQNFVMPTAGFFYFEGSATAGDSVQYTVTGALPFASNLLISFFDNSTAATATFILYGGTDLTNRFPGEIVFWGDSSAANATIILDGGGNGANGADAIFNENSTASSAHIFVNGGTEENGFGAVVLLQDTTTADQAVITVGGSDITGPGIIEFQGSSTAANATLIAKSGQASGGAISFDFIVGNPSGGTAKVKLHGNGGLSTTVPTLDIGSLEGDGIVSLLAGSALEVGSDGRDTTFSGTIENTNGSFVKIGPGTLTLTGASSYGGGTRIEDGTLVVNNRDGSGTGTRQVQVNGGQLSGRGTIAGSVTIGTGSGTGAVIAPGGETDTQPGTLTINGNLTFNSNATYTYSYKASSNTANTDLVIANGVTINSGATLDFNGTIHGRLTPGLVFTLISNTSADPVSGTFSNLPDGSTVILAGNTFQVTYEGGDGNDLTLTVVE